MILPGSATDHADVIIVGAGPAGATTALLLARAGIDVLLLDRQRFPRAKACGDCISAGANAVLARIGLLAAVHAQPHARLRGWRIVAPDGSAFAAQFDPGQHALAIERRRLDAAIVDAAIHAGARFEHRRVTGLRFAADGRVTGVDTHGGALHARYVIGADGLRSIVAARLSAIRRPARLRKLSLTAHVDRALIADAIGEMHVGDGICAGIAPVTAAGDRCNVTVVADSGRFGRHVAADARSFFLHALDSLPRTRARITAADLDGAQLLASGPFDRPARRTTFDGALLVGDAAGYYDPFTGQGVFQALASAELLATALAAELAAGNRPTAALAAYAAERKRLLRGARLVQHGIERVLARPALANRSIARIARAPAFARAILDVTGDIAPAIRLLSPRAVSSLLVPPRMSRSDP